MEQTTINCIVSRQCFKTIYISLTPLTRSKMDKNNTKSKKGLWNLELLLIQADSASNTCYFLCKTKDELKERTRNPDVEAKSPCKSLPSKKT